LSGDSSRSISQYRLQLAASAYTPVDDESIPTGKIAPVDPGRDFRSARAVGTAIYDCNFVLDGWDGSLRHAGTLCDPESGRTLAVETTQHFADAPHHSNFPSTVLRPGETFTSSTIYRFGVLE
jgi:aldose 1-epimerase